MLAGQSLCKPLLFMRLSYVNVWCELKKAIKHQGDELKTQRELIIQVLSQMDKRFEQVVRILLY